MTQAQINWLTTRGFSVQQLTDSGRYMLVRGEHVILERPDSINVGWTIKTPNGTYRTALRSAIEMALSA